MGKSCSEQSLSQGTASDGEVFRERWGSLAVNGLGAKARRAMGKSCGERSLSQGAASDGQVLL